MPTRTIHDYAAGFETYDYKEEISPGQIRLLKLIDVTKGGLPHFTFTVVDIPNPSIPYLALSYVWGSEEDRWPIIVDGKRLKVTQNCWAALAYLEPKLRDTNNHIWIDAICINQGYAGDGAANIMNFRREKAGQIAQMGDIYSHAEHVVVFLGVPFRGSDTAMKDMNRVGKEALEAGIGSLTERHMAAWPSFDNFPENERSEALAVKSGLDNLIDSNLGGLFHSPGIATRAMTTVLDKPWFTRAWIIQELTLPEPGKVTLLCGAGECSWERMWAATFFLNLMIAREASTLQNVQTWLLQWTVRAFVLMRFWRQVGIFPNWTGVRAGTTLGIRKKFWRHREVAAGSADAVPMNRSLKRLLTTLYVGDMAKMLGCRDPEDKIQAIHGLILPEEREWLTPLLLKQPALTWIELYTAVAGRLIVDGHVDLLSLCRGGKDDRSMLPSWVPDWRHRIRTPWSGLKGGSAELPTVQIFTAGHDTVCRVSLSHGTISSQSVLVIVGHYVDTIKEVKSPWTAHLDQNFDWTAAGTMLTEIEALLEGSDIYPEQSRDEAKWRIPIGDKETNSAGQTVRAIGLSQTGYEEMKRSLQTWLPGASFQGMGTTSFMNTMNSMYGSCPFVSEKGYVGLCPQGTKPGATIFIPLGSHVPYVIEKTVLSGHAEEAAAKPPAGTWRLLGEAYMHGIMDGELNLPSHPDHAEDFQIE